MTLPIKAKFFSQVPWHNLLEKQTFKDLIVGLIESQEASPEPEHPPLTSIPFTRKKKKRKKKKKKQKKKRRRRRKEKKRKKKERKRREIFNDYPLVTCYGSKTSLMGWWHVIGNIYRSQVKNHTKKKKKKSYISN